MNISCSATPCPLILSSKCVIYEGASLVYTNINTNDSVQVALQKIDAAIGIVSGGGITQLGPIGSSPNLFGASIVGGTLNLQPANGTFGGVVSDTTQSFVGAKTFINGVTAPSYNGLVLSGNSISWGGGTGPLASTSLGTNYIYSGSSNFVITTQAGSTTLLAIDGTSGNINTIGTITASIPAKATPASVFLTHTGGLIQSRTASEVRGDIGAGIGNVTSVAALTLGTTGTDLTSSVANSTTTPVITLNVPTASASNRGALSSTDWSTFNNKQVAGNYITDLTGEGTASGPGSVPLTLNNSAVINKVLSGLSVTGTTIIATDSILQAFGKTQNQINALIGGVNYQGTWNANTNSPILTSSVGTKGYYYVVSVAGSTNLNGITDWKLGDWAIFNGTVWEKVDNTDAVISVNGQTGIVLLSLASSDFANQGTATTVLHGNASGNPSWAAISNSDLTNSSLTIGSTNIALGATSTTLAGLTSLASTDVTFTGALKTTNGNIISFGSGNNYFYSGSSSFYVANDTGSTALFTVMNTTGDTVVLGTLTNTGLTSGSAGNFVVNGGSGLLVTRTAAQVLSDIGAAPASGGAYLPLAGGTMVGNILFTDNTYDIGASGATRPRTGYFGTSVISPSFVGALTGNATTASATTGTLTFGTYLQSSGSSFNGSTNTTISTNATPSSTASTIVARDGSGNFVIQNILSFTTGSNTITAVSGGLTLTGIVTGTSFTGAGTGLTGTASSLSIGGTAAVGTTVTITDDTTTNATNYPLFVNSPSGDRTVRAASTKLTFNPSTAVLTTTTFSGSLSGNATTATTATNLAGGSGGTIPYQSAAGTTAMLANGTAGYILQSNGTTLPPTWVNPSVGEVTSITGTANQVIASSPTGAVILSLPQSIGTTSDVTFNSVTAALIGNASTATNTVGTLTFGTHLTSGGSSFNGSNTTITSDATSSSTASTIMARDGSGNTTLQNILSFTTSSRAITADGSGLTANSNFFASNLSGTNTGDQTTSGTTNRISVSTGSTNPVIDISASYVGQSSITTVGTITSGTWSGLFGAVTGANLTHLTAANIDAGTAGINITGNAGTVTTNANLTGPITSVGNATSIASQTGTGTTFMMSASPTTTGTFTGAISNWSGLMTVGTSASTSGAPIPDMFWVREDNTGDNVVSAAIRTTKTGTASTSTVTGLNVWSSTSHTSGTIGNINSIRGYFNNTGNSAPITMARGVAAIAEINGTGAISTLRLFDASSFNGGSSTITDAVGFYMEAYPTSGITITNKYGVWINDATADNLFKGTMNIGSTLSLSKAAANAIIQSTDTASTLLLQTSTSLSGPAIVMVGNTSSINGGCLAHRYGDSSASVATLNARTNGTNFSVSMYSSDFPSGSLRRFMLMGTNGYVLLKSYDSGTVTYATERLEVDGNVKATSFIGALNATTASATGDITFGSGTTIGTPSLVHIIGINNSNNTEQNGISFGDSVGDVLGRLVGYRGANGNDGRMRLYSGQSPEVLSQTWDANGVVTIHQLGTGAVQATAGVLSVVSDSRVKDLHGEFEGSALDAIIKIPKPQYWNYNKNSKLPQQALEIRQFGLIADWVYDSVGEEFAPTQEDEMHSLSDRALGALNIQATQEMYEKFNSEICELREQLNNLLKMKND